MGKRTAHDVCAVVDLGEVGIVGATQEPEVPDRVAPTVAEGTAVVEFEPLARRAAPVLCVHVAAAVPVALTNSTPHRGRDVP